MKPGSAARLGLLGLLWGSSFLWVEVLLEGMSPVQITLARVALGALLLNAVVAARGLRLPRDRRTWLALTVAAVGSNAVPYTLFGLGQRTVDSAVAGAINATTPLWTFAVALAVGAERRLGRRRSDLRRTGGLAVGFTGAVLLLSPWSAGADVAGSLACLGAALSYGLTYVYVGRRLVGGPDEATPRGRADTALVLSAAQLIASTALLAPVVAVAGRGAIEVDGRALGALAVLGLGGTGIAYVLSYRLVADEGPTAASTVTYLIPAMAVALGVGVRDEPLTWQLCAGTLTVLAGVALAQRPREASGPGQDAAAPTRT